MNDTNLSILTAVINAFLVGFKYAKNYSYNVSKNELPNRGKSFDLHYNCPHCIRKIRTKLCNWL